MSDVRPLPARPSLEFERKAAKALLAALRSQDADAWSRARAIDARFPIAPKLADVQRVIAREYGFVSWGRLVQYYGVAARSGTSQGSMHTRAQLEDFAKSFPSSVAARREWALDAFAAYVPRVYGRRGKDLWQEAVSDDEARLVTARRHGALSWSELMAIAPEVERRSADWNPPTRKLAFEAIRRADLQALKAICAEHPEVFNSTDHELRTGDSLMACAIDLEGEHGLGREAMAPIVAWLVEQGGSVQAELQRRLRRAPFMSTKDLQRLIDRGADVRTPDAHGIPLMELALLRLWPVESVDLLAKHCVPRQALWIAAGVGDMSALASFFDGEVPRPSSYAIRPAWEVAWGRGALPAVVDPTVEDALFEALLVAVMNQRIEVIRFLVARGAPINRIWYDMSLLAMAVANSDNTELVRTMLSLGADPNGTDGSATQSAREVAKWIFLDSVPRRPIRAEMAQLMGWDPDALMAERKAATEASVPMDQRVQLAMRLAADDARREGDETLGPVNVLFGIARTLSGGLLQAPGGIDTVRFARSFRDRLSAPAPDSFDEVPLSPATEQVIERARVIVRERASAAMGAATMIIALLDEPDVAAILREHGADIEELRRQLARG